MHVFDLQSGATDLRQLLLVFLQVYKILWLSPILSPIRNSIVWAVYKLAIWKHLWVTEGHFLEPKATCWRPRPLQAAELIRPTGKGFRCPLQWLLLSVQLSYWAWSPQLFLSFLSPSHWGKWITEIDGFHCL